MAISASGIVPILARHGEIAHSNVAIRVAIRAMKRTAIPHHTHHWHSRPKSCQVYPT